MKVYSQEQIKRIIKEIEKIDDSEKGNPAKDDLNNKPFANSYIDNHTEALEDIETDKVLTNNLTKTKKSNQRKLVDLICVKCKNKLSIDSKKLNSDFDKVDYICEVCLNKILKEQNERE